MNRYQFWTKTVILLIGGSILIASILSEDKSFSYIGIGMLASSLGDSLAIGAKTAQEKMKR